MKITCVGYGFDLHRFGGDRSLRLGGVSIDTDKKVKAHSDGDVVLHALIDALLGVLGLGDIGDLFPDDSPSTEQMDSRDMLLAVLSAGKIVGLKVINVDLTVVLDDPKLGEKKTEIRDRLAELLGVPRAYVSVKAKTSEGLYPDAIACHCVCLCERARTD